MKKFILILSLLTTILLVGCNNEANEEVKPFRDAILNYDIKETSGFLYQSKQTIEENIFNQDMVDLKMDWADNQMYTEFYERRLNDLEAETPFSETSYTTYYNDNQIGHQVADGEVTWQAGTIESYLTYKMPIRTIFPSYFESYTVTENLEGKSIAGVLKDTNAIYGFKKTSESVSLTIQLTTEGKIDYIEISIIDGDSTIEITYQVFYDTQVVVIP